MSVSEPIPNNLIESINVGLSSKEANRRLKENGPNSISNRSENSALRLFLRQFKSPIILILFGATFISMFAGDITDGVIILAIIIPSGALGFWQEYRAGKTMAGLISQVEVHVETFRDCKEISVPITEIVIGDLVILRAGDLVPADMQVIKADSLMVDESVITGESFPREKTVGEIDSRKPLAERTGELFSGTHVVSGIGQGLVVKTGVATEFGVLSKEIATKDVVTGFERGTTAFGMLLFHSMMGLVSTLFIINMILHRPILDSLLFSLALAVGLTPQLLPVIISVSLSAGARRMAQRKVLVKRLDAIEDFGVMSILCTDKTGTITKGVVSLDEALDTSGEQSESVLRLAFLNASLQKGFVNPLDAAIIESVADKFSVAPKLLGEVPYDFQRRALSILIADPEPTMITKGSFDRIMSVCATARSGDTRIPMGQAQQSLVAKFTELSAQGNRVLAISTKIMPSVDLINVNDECEMVFEGLLVFMDPPKADASAAIAELADLGIELYLITGDNALVAQSISKQVGLNADVVISGKEISNMSESQLVLRAKNCRIFAEVDPIQKERIVQALRSTGATVGYFGDGINDAASLHAADVGISVDTATDVAKSVASIVLLDKDLAVIAEGIRLGRRTFVNTMKYVRVGVSAAFGNVFSMAVADIFLPFLPLLPMQILLLNFMTDFPAVTIAGDVVDSERLVHPSVWDIKAIRKFMISFGLLSSVFDILTFLVLRLGFHADAQLFRAGWFVESTLTELSVMMVLRTNRRFWQSRPGKGLLWSSVILTALTLSITYLPINSLLGLKPLPLTLMATLLVLIAVYICLNEVAKKYWMP